MGEVQEELQELGKKFESVEQELKEKEAELALAIENASLPRPNPRRPSRSWTR